MKRTKLHLITSISLMGAMMPAAAYGQEESRSDGLLEEIVISARKRDENLQDTPVSVSAIGETKLARLQAQEIGDIQNSVPGLTLHVGDASNAVVYVRGVGQIDSLAFADPGVGIYLDDVYLGRAQGSFLDVYDVARIEVLRGPQGTLYGRNTIGGAVKFVSKEPDDELGGQVEVAAGNYEQKRVKARANVPLGDTVFMKAAIAYVGRDGYAENSVTGSDDGDKESLSWRLGLKADLSDTLSLSLNADQSEDDADTSRTPNRETSVFGLASESDEPFEVDADFNDVNRLKTMGFSGTLTYDVSEALSIKSISAYREMSYETHLDLDATSLPLFGVFVDQDQDQFSQEVQFTYVGENGVDFVGGLYYLREHDITMSGIFGPAIAFVSNSINDQRNRSYAAYGQTDFPLGDKLTLTAGLRYTHEKKSFDRIQEFFGAETPLVPPIGEGVRVTDVSVEETWNNLSPKIGLSYQVDEAHMIYASASKGFKSGGFDGRSNSASEAVPYEPETMWAFEMGSKNSLAGGRASLNIAAYYNDYSNLQLSSFVADDAGAFSALFTNAGEATIKGIELEFAARPVEPLNISAAVSYMDADYGEYVGPDGADISDERALVNAPEWTLFLAVDYDIELASGAFITLHGDASYRSKTYPTVSSSEILAQAGYGLLNAQVSYQSAGERWELFAGVKNLTDREYRSHGFDLSDSLGYQLGYYGAPRTWSVGIRFDF